MWRLFLLLSACSGPEPVVASARHPLEGRWDVRWTRPEAWSPRVFTGHLVLRERDGEWDGTLVFDQSLGVWELQSLVVGDPHGLRFGAISMEVRTDGGGLHGTASWPPLIEATPLVGHRRQAERLPGAALEPVSPGVERESGLTPWADPTPREQSRPRFSERGTDLWRWRTDRDASVIEHGPLDALWRHAVTLPTRWLAWWSPRPDGQSAVAVGWAGQVYEVSQAVRVVANAPGTVRWVVPQWGESERVVVLLEPPSGGLRVVAVSLVDGTVTTLAEHPSAADVTLAADLTVRTWWSKEVTSGGRGVSRWEWRALDGTTPTLHQPTWVVDAGPFPHVGDGPVGMLAGSDLVTLQTLTPRGPVPHQISGAWADATHVFRQADGTVDAVGWTAERLHWDPLTPAGHDLVWLSEYLDANVRVVSRSGDDQAWLFQAWSGNHARFTAHLDRASRGVTPLDRPVVAPHPGRSQPLVLAARDGRRLAAILTTPQETRAPWPLVVQVHGGPWSGRHPWQLDARAQGWAERGYATLQVDFRGTHGFGWALTHSDEAAFGDQMIEDLEDAIDWAIEQGHADPSEIAMVGASYGGYAALRFATAETPRLKCAVGGLVRGNLTVPGGGLNIESVRTPAWRRAHSPDRFTERLTGPVLVWNGGLDGANPDAIQDFVHAAERHGKSVAWVRFPYEEHGLQSAYNRHAMAVIEDRFLSRCFGGPAWPIPLDFGRAVLEVRAGVDLIPGLSHFVRRRP